MRRRTKIVATLGPAVASPEKVEALVAAGANVVRLNCSHGDWDGKRDFIRWTRELNTGFSPVAVLADLQGPKFRIGPIEGGFVELAVGDSLTIGHGPGATVPMADDEVWSGMAPGDRVLFGDGDVEVALGDRRGGLFTAEALTGGKVKSRQGVTLVGKSFDAPAITDKDLEDVEQAIRYGCDYIALSYVRHPDDMRRLREIVEGKDPGVKLVAKIETPEALELLDGVVEASDAVMVARGDLGLQMRLEDVPIAQKLIIRTANRAGKPVITATQMLESMIVNARPTRAEATDIANAILDGTDALMLSGETATGAYPVEAVRTMARIAERTEETLDPNQRLAEPGQSLDRGVPTEAVALASVAIANRLGVRAILTTSASGMTPRLVSKYRPGVPILCAAWDERTQQQMALVWGVESVRMPPTNNTDEAVAFLTESFLKRGVLRKGDEFVVTAGYPTGSRGNTNMILVLRA